jgi:hypothetical protein
MPRGMLPQAAMPGGGRPGPDAPDKLVIQRFSRAVLSLDSSHRTLITAKSTAKPKPRTQVKYHMICSLFQ